MKFLALLASAAPAATLAGCLPLPKASPVPTALRPKHYIDAHCHIFNAADVPAKNFISKVVVPESPIFVKWLDQMGVVAALVAMMTRGAPDATAEIDCLDATSPNECRARAGAGPSSGTPTATTLAGALSDGLDVLDPIKAGPSEPTPPPPEDIDAYLAFRRNNAERETTDGPLSISDLQATAGPSEGAPAPSTTPLLLGALTLLKVFGTGPEADRLRQFEPLDESRPLQAESAAHSQAVGDAAIAYHRQKQEIATRIESYRAEDDPSFFDRLWGYAGNALGFINRVAWQVAYALRWAASQTRFRAENAMALAALFPARDADGGVRLYANSLLDYDFWLDPNAGRPLDGPEEEQPEVKVTVSRQADAASRIAREDFNGTRFLSFFAFCPLRSALATKAKEQNKEALMRTLGGGDHPIKLLQRALGEQGFLGVKLYPPMGFYPFGNKEHYESARTDFYPKELHTLLKRSDIAALGVEIAHLPGLIDAELTKFYGECLTYDAPVLTHTSASQNAFKAAQLRSNPKHWGELLQSNDDYRKLRLNLGHLGGLWCLGKRDSKDLPGNACESLLNDSAQGLDEHPELLRNTWAGVTLRMLNAQNKNLYADFADFSYFSNPFEAPQRKLSLKNIVALMKVFGQPPADAFKRLLYGTDWSLLGRDVGHENYYRGMAWFMKDAAEQLSLPPAEIVDDLTWRNAARFFGLQKVDAATGEMPKTRERLEEFFQNDPKALDFLSAFDDA